MNLAFLELPEAKLTKTINIPEDNIDFKNLPQTAKIEDTGKMYIAHLDNRQRAVVCWTGSDAFNAQSSLRARAQFPR